MSDDDERYYSSKEVAKIFSVKSYTVSKWIREGTIQAVKIGTGHYWRIPHSEVERLARHKHGD